MDHSTRYKIVDDDDANLFAIELALADIDAELLLVNSGEAALELLMHETEVPALALIDVQMPGIDGYELARLIRENVRLQHVPIIFLSAVFQDIEHIFTGYESGAVDYITKPFSSSVLLAKAKIFLNLHRYRHESVQAQISKCEAVVKSEERLNAVMKITREAFWDWHIPSGHMEHNRQWYEGLGLQPCVVQNTVDSFAALIHPDDKPGVMQRLDALLHGETDSYQSEHRMVGRQGTIWVQDRGGVVERDKQGHPVRVVGSFSDVTERKLEQLELQSNRYHLGELVQIQNEELQRSFDELTVSEKKYRTLIETTGTGYLILNAQGYVLDANPEYVRLSGHRELKDILGRSVIQWTADQDKENHALAQCAGVIKDLVIDYVDGYGHITPVEINATIVMDADSQLFLALCRDVTNRKKIDTERKKLENQAHLANRAKSDFLATMSHEIRTPMNAVLGMAQLLAKPKLQDDKRIQYAQTILNAGHTLLSLLNNILDLSKVEAGKLKLESIAFAVDTLVGDIDSLFAETANAKGLQLKSVWQGPAGPCYLGDPHRLRQMLSNLISNAIKFTASGFVRIVACEIERQSQYAVLEFSVSDSGVGITNEQQARLFQPFSQADSSTTRQFGGSGLGLSIVLRLAQLMGGEVGIDSKPGQGARFWFRVRVMLQTGTQELPPIKAASVAMPVQDLKGAVLIAEDNPVNRMVIMAMLGELNCSGLTVTVVEDGQQALDFITQGGAPDLVLMDVQMPVMGGLDATEKIRLWEADQGQPRTTIVALTANAFEEDRQKCLASGMDDFLVKPLDMEKLQATLERWLKEKRLT